MCCIFTCLVSFTFASALNPKQIQNELFHVDASDTEMPDMLSGELETSLQLVNKELKTRNNPSTASIIKRLERIDLIVGIQDHKQGTIDLHLLEGGNQLIIVGDNSSETLNLSSIGGIKKMNVHCVEYNFKWISFLLWVRESDGMLYIIELDHFLKSRSLLSSTEVMRTPFQSTFKLLSFMMTGHGPTAPTKLLSFDMSQGESMPDSIQILQ